LCGVERMATFNLSLISGSFNFFLKNMKHANAFFVTGTLGMIITAVLHMVVATLVPATSVHLSFFVLYPVFLSVLTLGFRQMLRKKPAPVRVRK